MNPSKRPSLRAEKALSRHSFAPTRYCQRSANRLRTPFAATAISSSSRSSAAPLPDDDEVECMGESSRAEAEAARDAAGREAAIELDEEEPDA